MVGPILMRSPLPEAGLAHDLLVVDVRAVGGAVVDAPPGLAALLEVGVAARDAVALEDDVVLGPPADADGAAVEDEAPPEEAWLLRVDDDEAVIALGDRRRSPPRGFCTMAVTRVFSSGLAHAAGHSFKRCGLPTSRLLPHQGRGQGTPARRSGARMCSRSRQRLRLPREYEARTSRSRATGPRDRTRPYALAFHAALEKLGRKGTVIGRAQDGSHAYPATLERAEHAIGPREGAQKAQAQLRNLIPPEELATQEDAVQRRASVVRPRRVGDCPSSPTATIMSQAPTRLRTGARRSPLGGSAAARPQGSSRPPRAGRATRGRAQLERRRRGRARRRCVAASATASDRFGATTTLNPRGTQRLRGQQRFVPDLVERIVSAHHARTPRRRAVRVSDERDRDSP